MRRKGGKGEASRMKKPKRTKSYALQVHRDRKIVSVTLSAKTIAKLERLAREYGSKSAAVETLIDAADEP